MISFKVEQSCRSLRRSGKFRPALKSIALVLLATLTLVAQGAQSPNADEPLPQDSGATGLKLTLRQLQTTGRLMQTTAHPDDEDGGMLTLEARGKGETVLLMTLTRGEGGQNKVGSNLFDVLGVVRTLELLAADKYYGVQQRFSTVADFGFSKSPAESLEKWKGEEVALGDMVRVIRTFRPDVLVARFSGTERDGHGHHQASGILTKEAFRAAADPSKFPDQIKDGLRPWQAKKFYMGNVCGFGAKTCPAQDYTVKLNTGTTDPVIGQSYVQFAMAGLKHQLSQGAGNWSVEPGDRFTFYKLVDSVMNSTKDADGHEQGFFDGIDTTLPGLADRLGEEQSDVMYLKPALEEIAKSVNTAAAASDKGPGAALPALFEGASSLHKLIEKFASAQISAAAKQWLLMQLNVKRQQFENAINLASGASLTVTADVPPGADADHAFMIVPGERFTVTARFTSSQPVSLNGIKLDLPVGWSSRQLPASKAVEGSKTVSFEITVPEDAEYTKPYWHRDNPETESLNHIDVPEDITLPFPPAPVQAQANYYLNGKSATIHSVGEVSFKDADGMIVSRALAVAPLLSVAMDPVEQVIPVGANSSSPAMVAVTCEGTEKVSGTVRLESPAGWTVNPAQLPVTCSERGKTSDYKFELRPADLREGRAQVRAVVQAGGKTYSEGYSVVSREDLNTFYYYQPAIQRVSVVDVKVPRGLRVGYIMGAGDEIPPVLKQIGMNVTEIAPGDLGKTDLSAYDTIVLGIRAYDTQKEVAGNNKKLLDFVSAGGTLVVQYNTDVSSFNSGHFTPYPADLSRERVSVETVPVQLLAPEDSMFLYPNKISAADFSGWVQERGLYFMSTWDSHFSPLLESHDPGEQPQKGGLLRASFGKGTYIYTSYAFFRQLPSGVPGAIRLYVNLLSAGHENKPPVPNHSGM